MRRSFVRAFRAFGPAIAAIGALGLAVQSCGVMSSAGDCQERADCPADAAEAAVSDAVPPFDGSEASNSGDDDAPDQDIEVDALEARPDGDATTSDASDSAGGVDAADAADAADARRDVVSQDVVSEDVVARDTCSPTESCNNGIDDNCDGKIDCADPECGAYSCATAVPTGWVGPALFWTGAAGATAPACPAGYQDAFDAHAGPTGSAGTCSCTCNASGQVCSTTGNFMSQSACQAVSQCRSVTVDSSGSCATASTGGCGTMGSFGAPVPTPNGGTCTPQPTMTSGGPPGWTTSARVCSWIGAVDSPGGCPVATDQCVSAPVAPFGTSFCIYQSGSVACPTGYPIQSIVYSGETDGRGCTACTCGTTVSGGSCSGTIALYGDSAGGCNGSPPATYSLGTTTCFTYSGLSLNPGFAKANFTVLPGACSVATQPSPTGTVTGSGPLTVCCF